MTTRRKSKPPWTCRKCKNKNPNRRLRNCPKCGTKRPVKKLTKHQQLLADNRSRYKDILAAQGGVCALCGNLPKPGRRLDLDHDHKRMVIRGLLCHKCNRFLQYWMTPEWFLKAADYIIGEA